MLMHVAAGSDRLDEQIFAASKAERLRILAELHRAREESAHCDAILTTIEAANTAVAKKERVS